MTLAEAFAKSVNTAAARLAQQVGLNRVIAAARDLGVSVVPGAAEMNLLEFTAAYAAAKAGEMPIKPWAYGIRRGAAAAPPVDRAAHWRDAVLAALSETFA